MKLLCIEFSDPFWIDVIRQVEAQTGARPVYWSAAASREQAVRAAFPGVVFQENLLAVRGVAPSDIKPADLRYPDSKMLNELLETQAVALKMMDRMDPTGFEFGYEERLRHFFRLVACWNALLDKFKPSAVLMPIAPHMIYDFVIYGLCKLRGIPTLMFDRTAIPGRVLAMDCYDGASPALRQRYKQRLEEKITPNLRREVETYLTRIQKDFASGMAPNFKLKMSRLGLSSKSGIAKPSLLQIARYEIKGIYRNIARQRLRVPRTYVKVKRHPPEELTVGHVGYYFNRWRGMVRKSKLQREYERLQKIPDFGLPYIFVALHFQPERNTVPLGGHYAEQFLLIAQLSDTLPAGWKIYVKEHGWQLQPYSRGQHGRTSTFYSDLARLPNVELVPIETASFELIDHSRAVASVSGSVGWEAINRGKPAMVFGEAWYQDCEGVFNVRSSEQVKLAMDAIRDGEIVDREKVRQFIAALEDVALPAVLEFHLEDQGLITLDQSIASLAGSFVERLSLIGK
jgi:hypothetical protein